MTGRAYSEAFPADTVPLTITLTAWVTLAAALTTDDPAKQVAFADVVTNAALRESFLAVAVGYTYAEVAELARTLADHPDPASPSDVSEFVQQTFDDLEAEIAVGDSPEAMRVRGSRLLASRSTRRNQRARRAEELTHERVERARDEERARAEAQVHAVLKAAADDRAALERDLADKDDAPAAQQAAAELKVRRQKRVTRAACLALSCAALAVVTGIAGHLTTAPRWGPGGPRWCWSAASASPTSPSPTCRGGSWSARASWRSSSTS